MTPLFEQVQTFQCVFVPTWLEWSVLRTLKIDRLEKDEQDQNDLQSKTYKTTYMWSKLQ